jgi:hypothetical protein
MVFEVLGPIKTDFDYPYGPAHRDHESNSREDPDSNNKQEKGDVSEEYQDRK